MARTEIELNKEVLDYKESIFFGLSLRQFVCASLAVMIAVIVWFGTRGIIAKEIRSWLCLIFACPFAAAGFFSFNGLTLEQFMWQMLKSCLIYRGDVYKRQVNSAVAIVWGYLAENIFNMLALVGLVKGSDRIVKEIFGL